MFRLPIILILCALSAPAATTYHVRKNGSDANPGTTLLPFLTADKARSVMVPGDTAILGHGVWEEYIQVTAPLTTWKAETNRTAEIRALRFDAETNYVEGLRILKACDADWRSWGANVYLGSGAHYTTLTNCIIGDQPRIKATNWSFNPSGNNTIVGTGIDFVAAGFATGGVFWINGPSYSNTTRGAEFRSVNQQRAVRPIVVTQTVLTFSNAVLSAETNPVASAVISAGMTFDWRGVTFTPSGGSGPSHCLVIDCDITNMVGQAFFVNGHDNRFIRNKIIDVDGNSFFVYGGYNLTIVSNLMIRSRLPAYYSELEVVDHTGGTFYDYYVRSMIGSALQTHNTNVLYAWNWHQDIDGAGHGIQHASNSDPGDFHTFKHHNNVYVGVGGPSDGGHDQMYFDSNTWVRCSFQTGYSPSPLTLGGELGTYTNTGLSFTYNLMSANGSHDAHTNEGYPSFVATVDITSSSNFVSGPEVSDWNAMPSWPATNGINGGDPMFVNEYDPLGPDGLPFTEDDGLRLHPNSPALGIGALPVATATSNKPIAFFRPIVASNYLDWRGTNLNINWHTQLYAFQRTSWDRTWDRGDALFNLPQFDVRFEATNSISGTWSTNSWIGITDFVWDMGDGSHRIWNRWQVPEVTHSFVKAGPVTVTLWVTNTAGGVASHSRNYYILPGTNAANEVIYVSLLGNDANSGLATNLAKRTITNGVARCGPGDTLVLLGESGGNFAEWVDVDPTSSSGPRTNGTADLPIRVVGLGARTEGVRQEVDWWIWETVEFGGDTTMTSVGRDSYFKVADLVNGISWIGCKWMGEFMVTNVSAIHQAASGGVGGTNHVIRYCFISKILGHPADSVVHFSGVSNIVYDASQDEYLGGQADALKVYGKRVRWTRHWSQFFGYTNNNHSDWMSFGIDDTIPTEDIFVDSCVAISHFGPSTAIANNGRSTWLQDTNLTVQNCLFIDFMNGMNPVGFNGTRLLHNTFYRSPWTNQAVTTWGINKSALSEDVRNNVFLECYEHGHDDSGGWYLNGYLVSGILDTNVTFVAGSPDYNYVGGTNFASKAAAPPDNVFRFGITGQEANGHNGGDPGITDITTRDIRLLTNSILRGTAVTITSVTNDMFGQPLELSGRDKGPMKFLAAVAAGGGSGSSTNNHRNVKRTGSSVGGARRGR